MPGEHVDRAPLAPFRVRDLGLGLPAKTAQPRRANALQRRMALIEESMLIGAETANAALVAQAEYRNDHADGASAHGSDSTGFELRDDARPDSGSRRQVNLPPSAAVAQDANQPSEPRVIHVRQDRRLGSSASYRLFGRWTRSELAGLDRGLASARARASNYWAPRPFPALTDLVGSEAYARAGPRFGLNVAAEKPDRAGSPRGSSRQTRFFRPATDDKVRWTRNLTTRDGAPQGLRRRTRGPRRRT
jgi:hypothetical protein